MRFGISIPQFFADGEFDPDRLRAFVTRAERLGFHSAWTQEQVLGIQPQLDAIQIMTMAAAYTERIRLGCAVFVTPLHMPAHLAKSLSSLDQISRGRLEVGVGAGGKFRPFGAFGLDAEGYISRFTEGIDLMRQLWTNERVTFDGRFAQLKNAGMEPKPFQKPGPPLWFGGSAPAALRRAVRLGDGFFGAGSTTTAAFAGQVRTVREALAEDGREPDTFPIAKRVYIALDDDRERGRRRMEEALHRLYAGAPLQNIIDVAVYGPAEDCVRGLQAVADAGAGTILLTPMFDSDEQMDRLAAEVIASIA